LRIRESLVHGGSFYLVKTRLPDGVFLRTTIINARTTEGDLLDLLEAIREAAKQVIV
jgi:L-2,4-diaminobutyrate decarboxylase